MLVHPQFTHDDVMHGRGHLPPGILVTATHKLHVRYAQWYYLKYKRAKRNNNLPPAGLIHRHFLM